MADKIYDLGNGKTMTQSEVDFFMQYGTPELKTQLRSIIQGNSAGSLLDGNPLDVMKALGESGDSSYMEKYLDNALALQNEQSARDYEERMSNTAYQRAMTDMKAAGLNPWLLAGGGQASSTPSASAAQVSNVNATSNSIARENMIMSFLGSLIGSSFQTAGYLGGASILKKNR